MRTVRRLGAAPSTRTARGLRVLAALVAGVLGVLAGGPAVRPAAAAVSLGGWMAHSPDDISGFTTLTGNDSVTAVALPFTFVVEGVGYTSIALSTNGWIEFGGNTSGDSDPTNDCLPTSAHTNPLLAMYWDDLAPFGTQVRYGTVGSAPNRVFIADYEVDLTSGVEGQDDLRFQVQLHEGSNVATIRYRDTQNQANGQQATIGFQGAGGASATTVQPIVCNGKVLDDNRPDEGWSADLGRAGQVTLAAMMAHSPDDITGFTTLAGSDSVTNVSLPFGVTIEGTTYNTVAVSTDGWLEFGGNTAGNSDPSNDCLPTPAHTNPFLAAYWDDLNPFGTAVRYGIVGQSPNRVFIVDYNVDLAIGEGSDDLGFQVQVHERSNLINVRYRDKQANAVGQLATIGFQGAGGGSARAYPITCNGRVMDTADEEKDGWSIHPKAVAMSPHGVMAHTPANIDSGTVPGLQTFSGDDVVQTATMPFAITIDGVAYNTVALSTNGWLEFGGNTAGDSDPTNDCLPTAAHTNPFFAAFWDDMRTAGSSTIKYGTVGQSPNRTFLVDYFLDTKTSSDDGNDDVEIQVQVHEGSNAIFVKYRHAQRLANGQTATIGWQGAGGAAAQAMPVGCNAKVLDDNRNDSGWSVAPLPVCGNGIVEALGNEQCDQGGANGSATSCCTTSCTFKSAGTTCRVGGGAPCDLDEVCTGSSGTCPADDAPGKVGLTCRIGSGDACDPAEYCTAIPGAACPADHVEPAGTVCRTATGVCDVAEECSGVAGEACPADEHAPAGGSCEADGDLCTVDTCDGSGACTTTGPLDCDDGNRCTQDSCDPSVGCVATGAPSNACLAGSKVTFQVKDSLSDNSDRLKMSWKGGPMLVPDLGDPRVDTVYELCIYDDTGVKMALDVPAGPGWSALGSAASPRGFKFKGNGSADGVRSIVLKGSSLPKASFKLVAKGAALPDTTLPFQSPVVAQLYAGDGMCWGATFGVADTKKNDVGGFSAKVQ
jgi:hypothetical protein